MYLICVCIDNLAHSVYWFCVFFYAFGHIHSVYRICVFVDNFEQAHSVYWFCVFVISLSRYFLIFIQEKSCCKQQQGSLKHFRILLTHFTPMFPFYSPRRQKTNRFPLFSEAALQRWILGKVFWKYAANLQKNTHTEVWFQERCFATLFKSHMGMDVHL